MILIISPDTKNAGYIASACGPDATLHHFNQTRPEIVDISNFVDEHEIDIAIVGPNIAQPWAEEVTRALANRYPFLGLITCVDDGVESIRGALRAGATDVVSPTMAHDEIVETIDRVRFRVDRRLEVGGATRPWGRPPNHIVTVVSFRGGAGRTLISTSLSTALERHFPDETVLVDLDLQSGDIAGMFGLTPHLSIASMAGRLDGLDSAEVKALLTRTENGMHLLAAPKSLSAAVEVGPRLVTSILKVLAASFRYVVIDTSAQISEVSLAAIDASTDIVLVCSPDVPSVRALRRATDALDELEVTGARRHLVINKATPRYGMPLRDIEALSGMSAVAQVPATKDLAMALNRGEPIHDIITERSGVAKALCPLVQELSTESTGATHKRRFLSRAR